MICFVAVLTGRADTLNDALVKLIRTARCLIFDGRWYDRPFIVSALRL
jgi:hypothetical protein